MPPSRVLHYEITFSSSFLPFFFFLANSNQKNCHLVTMTFLSTFASFTPKYQYLRVEKKNKFAIYIMAHNIFFSSILEAIKRHCFSIFLFSWFQFQFLGAISNSFFFPAPFSQIETSITRQLVRLRDPWNNRKEQRGSVWRADGFSDARRVYETALSEISRLMASAILRRRFLKWRAEFLPPPLETKYFRSFPSSRCVSIKFEFDLGGKAKGRTFILISRANNWVIESAYSSTRIIGRMFWKV